MGRDIRDEKGYIGDYEGCEVHVISRKDFDKMSQVQRNKIYALVQPGKYESIMVKNMVVIGHLNPDGGVTEYDNPFDYISSSRKNKVKEEVKKKEQHCTHKEQTEGWAPTNADDFLHYVANEWDPVTLAIGMFDLTVKPIAVPKSVG